MKSKGEILETNIKQKEFYNTKKKNTATKVWSYIREKTLKKLRKNIGVLDDTYALHQQWFGDLLDKKVLDLGCFSGNTLSMQLAQNAKEYIGIDLSDIAIAKFNQRLDSIPSAKAVAIDFFSDEFTDTNFDLIYAYGVLHHFPNLDILIERLQEKLAIKGQIISYDPLETSIPIKLMRMVYRPFQTDAAWEWPFTKSTVKKFQSAFKVIERRGLLGKSKWYYALNFLPLSESKKSKIGKKWHEQDWELSKTSDASLFSCMHITMFLEKK
jgi:2-polyprenyl-3-methyl-5-hydroxy-6-metoxy-1,4-benzoquinol methylase